MQKTAGGQVPEGSGEESIMLQFVSFQATQKTQSFHDKLTRHKHMILRKKFMIMQFVRQTNLIHSNCVKKSLVIL